MNSSPHVSYAVAQRAEHYNQQLTVAPDNLENMAAALHTPLELDDMQQVIVGEYGDLPDPHGKVRWYSNAEGKPELYDETRNIVARIPSSEFGTEPIEQSVVTQGVARALLVRKGLQMRRLLDYRIGRPLFALGLLSGLGGAVLNNDTITYSSGAAFAVGIGLSAWAANSRPNPTVPADLNYDAPPVIVETIR
jgi:hypothetical protein